MNQDYLVVRELAKKVRDIAALPIQEEKDSSGISTIR